MNHYGSQAMTHWRTWLPTRYAQIPNPETFFEKLGREVAEQIAELSTQLAGDDPPGESYLDKVGRLNMARVQAEETVLREQVLLEPEPGADPDTRNAPQEASGDWIPLVEDETSPYWAQVRDRDAQTGTDPTP